MKKLILLVSFIVSILPSYAVEPKYLVHTSAKDIEFKKARALKWYEDNVDKGKFYGYDANKHVDWLKNRALKWHENYTVNGKFYFVHSDHELAFTKKKALRWYERNSQ